MPKAGDTRLISMSTLLKTYWDEGRIDLLKLDIEGGGTGASRSNLNGLQRVDANHRGISSGLVDYPGLVAKLQKHGFRYIREFRFSGIIWIALFANHPLTSKLTLV